MHGRQKSDFWGSVLIIDSSGDISLGNIALLEVKGPSGARLLAGSPSGLLDFILCPLRRDNYRVLSPLVEEGSVLPWQPPALKCFFGIVCTLKLPSQMNCLDTHSAT